MSKLLLRLLALTGVAGPLWVEAYAGVLGGPVGRRAAPRRDHLLRPTLALDAGGAAIAVRNLDLWAGSSPLILDVNWDVRPNERWALVGPNGAGKSTLLRAIADAATGAVSADGQLAVSPTLRLGMLEQTAVSGSERTLREEVVSRMGAYRSAQLELVAAEEAAAAGTGAPAELERLECARVAFEAAGGYEIDARVARVLKGIGFLDDEFDQPCSSFSGGWQMRIGLARLLLSEPDILVLDEPTNHLDAAARRWLGEYVAAYSGTVLIVSHDEAFLSAAADSIAEVVGGRLDLYRSVAMDKFKAVRAERAQQAVSTVEAQEREAARLQGFIDRMGAKASKAKQAKDRQGKLDRLSKEMEAAKALVTGAGYTPRLTLAPPPASGALLLELDGAAIRHPQGSTDVLPSASLAVTKGMRLVVRGPNGAGKSTLLKALAGTLELRSGSRSTDERLSLGVFAQDLAQELPQRDVALEYVERAASSSSGTVTAERCRNVMGALGLRGDAATRRIGDLSGGEKARVALATFCLTPCNLVLLDEPTNHLDVDAIQALLDALDSYTGAVVVVSHDRAFCEAVRCTHVAVVADGALLLEERELRDGDWNEGRGLVNANAAELDARADAATERELARIAAQADRAAQKRRSAAPKRIAKLEQSIAEVEDEMGRVDSDMMSAGSDASRALELSARRSELATSLDAMYAEWEELEAMLQEV